MSFDTTQGTRSQQNGSHVPTYLTVGLPPGADLGAPKSPGLGALGADLGAPGADLGAKAGGLRGPPSPGLTAPGAGTAISGSEKLSGAGFGEQDSLGGGFGLELSVASGGGAGNGPALGWQIPASSHPKCRIVQLCPGCLP